MVVSKIYVAALVAQGAVVDLVMKQALKSEVFLKEVTAKVEVVGDGPMKSRWKLRVAALVKVGHRWWR